MNLKKKFVFCKEKFILTFVERVSGENFVTVNNKVGKAMNK